jgi:hypothetical protein
MNRIIRLTQETSFSSSLSSSARLNPTGAGWIDLILYPASRSATDYEIVSRRFQAINESKDGVWTTGVRES